MSKWINAATGQVTDTNVAGITANGTYFLLRNSMNPMLPFVFGATVKEAGHTASVHLYADVVGVRYSLGDAIVPTFGSPVALENEFSLTGERVIVVTSLTGAVYPEAIQ